MASSESLNVKRVILWAIPRSVSTSFLKCMTQVPNSQTWFEPHYMAYQYSNYGKYRKHVCGMLREFWGAEEADDSTYGSEISGGYWAADKSYDWIKTQLEHTPAEKEVVFVKDFSAGLDGMFENLPSGFQHSFLIRNPYQVFDSWERMLNRGIDDESKRNTIPLPQLPEYLMPSGKFYKEQNDLYQYVKEHYGQTPVVIDTEDLLANPRGVLKAYCERVGIPYSDNLLQHVQWEAGRECLDQQWIVAKEQILAQNLGGVHAETFNSTCFLKPGKEFNQGQVSDDVRQCAEKCMEYYNAMFADRLQVKNEK